MTIANPIYDIVFKYLMEDLDIAKGVLSTILDVEIEDLSIKPQETIAETEQSNKPIRIYRIDFAAVVKEKNGNYKKVLIELQKIKRSTNIIRFRRYLAENYQKEDTIVENGIEKKQSLEIVTIYFLGFSLENVPTPVLYIKNCYRDVVTGNDVEEAKKEDFIRLLNHESYMIQIRKLVPNAQTKLESVLSVFNQIYKTDDEHILNYHDNPVEPLVQKMLNVLFRAIASEDIRRKMDFEDEIDRDYQDLESKLDEKEQVIGKQEKMLEQKDQMLEQKDQMLNKKDQLIEELKRQLSEKNK